MSINVRCRRLRAFVHHGVKSGVQVKFLPNSQYLILKVRDLEIRQREPQCFK